MKQYERGATDLALSGFARAVALDASYDLARFNLACALARSELHDAAAIELELLVQRDLPRFLPRLARDNDLEEFRNSPIGAALFTAAQSLQIEWLQLARTGVAVNAWVPHVPIEREDLLEAVHQRPELLRTGVWLAAEQRFLPLGADVPDLLAGRADVNSQHALLIQGHVEPCLTDLCPRLTRLRLTAVADLRPLLAPTSESVAVNSADGSIMFNIAVELADGVLRWQTPSATPEWWEREQAPAVESRRAQTQAWLQGERLVVTPLGTLLAGVPKGWTLRASELETPSGHRVRLAARFAGDAVLVVPVPGTAQAVLLVNAAHCDCSNGETPVLRHEIGIIETTTGVMRPWLSGEMSAAVRVGPDASVYVQRDEVLERFTHAGAPAKESLPQGLVLTPPMLPDGNCCGL